MGDLGRVTAAWWAGVAAARWPPCRDDVWSGILDALHYLSADSRQVVGAASMFQVEATT